jgi:hypothetical protein
MVVLLVAQAQFMDAFVKSSNYFSYVLLSCQEANPSLSLKSKAQRETERKHKLLELPSFSLSLSLFMLQISRREMCRT